MKFTEKDLYHQDYFFLEKKINYYSYLNNYENI